MQYSLCTATLFSHSLDTTLCTTEFKIYSVFLETVFFFQNCPLMTGNTCSRFVYTWIISLKCLLILVDLVKWFLKYEAFCFNREAKEQMTE